MYKYLFVSTLLFFTFFNQVNAATETIKIYSDAGTGGVTTDGRMFEDRYSDWDTTIDSSSARITSMTENGQDLSNCLGSGYGSNYFSNNRLHFGFDTSSLPDNANIISASFFVQGGNYDGSTGTERRIYLVSGNPASNNSLITSDYSKVGNSAFGVSDGTWSLIDYTSIILNGDGLNWIKKEGVTNLVLRGWYDFNRVAPTDENELCVHIYFVEQEGTEFDPYLEITYTVEDGTEEKDVYELLEELIDAVEWYEFSCSIEKSYMAHLKKVEKFLNNGKYTPAKNQLRAFMQRIKQDKKHGKITVTQYDDLARRANEVMVAVQEL